MTKRVEETKPRRWPSFVFVLIVIAVTIYAFSPRPLPPFAPTTVKASELLVTGLAQQGKQIVAVGELGQILWTEDQGQTWHHATVPDAEGTTFTKVRFVAPHVAIAVGHAALIMRSADDGKTWTRVSYQPKLDQALMGISGPIDGKLFAYGFFGLLEISTDGGKRWTHQKFDITPLPTPKPKSEPKPGAKAQSKPSSGGFGFGGNLLASYVPHADPSTRHLYGLTQLSNGKLLLVGERGLIALSTDGGSTWTQQPKIYPGSFFGVLTPTPDTVLIYGLGGHVYRSTDNAGSWSRVSLPDPLSVFGGTVLANGNVVLVGAQQSVWVSSDGGQKFRLVSNADRGGFDAVLGTASQHIMAGGILGVRLESLAAPKDTATTGARS